MKALPLMKNSAYCGYSFICTSHAYGELYGSLFLLVTTVPRICHLSTRLIGFCCIFRVWETARKALLTLWDLFCYRVFLISVINQFPHFFKIKVYFNTRNLSRFGLHRLSRWHLISDSNYNSNWKLFNIKSST